MPNAFAVYRPETILVDTPGAIRSGLENANAFQRNEAHGMALAEKRAEFQRYPERMRQAEDARMNAMAKDRVGIAKDEALIGLYKAQADEASQKALIAKAKPFVGAVISLRDRWNELRDEFPNDSLESLQRRMAPYYNPVRDEMKTTMGKADEVYNPDAALRFIDDMMRVRELDIKEMEAETHRINAENVKHGRGSSGASSVWGQFQDRFMQMKNPATGQNYTREEAAAEADKRTEFAKKVPRGTYVLEVMKTAYISDPSQRQSLMDQAGQEWDRLNGSEQKGGSTALPVSELPSSKMMGGQSDVTYYYDAQGNRKERYR